MVWWQQKIFYFQPTRIDLIYDSCTYAEIAVIG